MNLDVLHNYVATKCHIRYKNLSYSSIFVSFIITALNVTVVYVFISFSDLISCTIFPSGSWFHNATSTLSLGACYICAVYLSGKEGGLLLVLSDIENNGDGPFMRTQYLLT